MQNLIEPDTKPIKTTNTLLPSWMIFTRYININLVNFGVFFVLLFLIPPVAMWATDMHELHKYFVATTMVVIALIHSFLKRKRLHELGIRKDTFKKSLFWNGIFTVSLSTVIYIAYINNFYRPSPLQEWEAIEAYFFYFLVCSPAQEFLYRSFLFSEMNQVKINNFWIQIFASSFAFSFFHIHHKDFFMLCITFFIGIIWSLLYQKYPNLITVSLSHGILGIVAILTRLI